VGELEFTGLLRGIAGYLKWIKGANDMGDCRKAYEQYAWILDSNYNIPFRSEEAQLMISLG